MSGASGYGMTHGMSVKDKAGAKSPHEMWKTKHKAHGMKDDDGQCPGCGATKNKKDYMLDLVPHEVRASKAGMGSLKGPESHGMDDDSDSMDDSDDSSM